MFIKNVPQIATYTTPGILKPDNETIEVDENGVLSIAPPPAEIVAQSTGSDDEVEAMINDYYAGKLSLEDIKGGWSVGDVRTANETDKAKFKIIAHSSFSGDSPSVISGQSTCKQVILDFDHDTLVTSINNITKALITIQMYGVLGSSASSQVSCLMNASSSNAGGQDESARRTQCNGNFYNALGFKSQVKQVVKQNCKNPNSSEITTTNDYCFLCSAYEVIGVNNYYAPGNEGIQYNYFKINSCLKNTGQEGAGGTTNQWLRSPGANTGYYFCIIDAYGSLNRQYASNGNAISVCTCL